MPKCKHKFIVMYKDEEIEENLKEINNIKIKMQELLREKRDVEKLMQQHKKLQCKNLEISEKYKNLYGR